MLKWIKENFPIKINILIEKNSPYEELKKFQEDRLLHLQDFNIKVGSLNILEELLEIHGVKDKKDREFSTMLYAQLNKVVNYVKVYERDFFKIPTVNDQVDGFCDIQTFADGEVRKLGFDNKLCMYECASEINSRVGKIIDGKFVKDKSFEARKNWYKADYDRCKV